MRIFVHEHITGGGLAGAPLPHSLRREGWTMLRSIVEDLSGVNGVERVVTTLDRRLESRARELSGAAVETVLVDEGGIEGTFRSLASNADATLVIAPELRGALGERTRWALSEKCRLLSPALEAVELAGDKLALAEALARADVPVASLERVDLSRPPPSGAVYPAVLKPRHGAGSQWTYRVEGPPDARRVFDEALREGCPGEMVIGPFVPGLPASASFLVGPRSVIPLLAGEQIITADGRFRYLGGRIPLPGTLGERALRLGERAVRAVPGLRGFAGVDLVLGPPCDRVIEVNPRLTTSYVGLRALARTNLAGAWLALDRGIDVPPLEWYGGGVSFLPEGSIIDKRTRDR